MASYTAEVEQAASKINVMNVAMLRQTLQLRRLNTEWCVMWRIRTFNVELKIPRTNAKSRINIARLTDRHIDTDNNTIKALPWQESSPSARLGASNDSRQAS